MKAGPLQLGVAPPANRGIAILDFFLRLIAIIGTLASAIAMATTNQTLPFFSQFVRFRAKFNDLPSFTFFVVASSIVSAYLILSLAISILHIVKAHAVNSRVLLLFLDTVHPTKNVAKNELDTVDVQMEIPENIWSELSVGARLAETDQEKREACLSVEAQSSSTETMTTWEKIKVEKEPRPKARSKRFNMTTPAYDPIKDPDTRLQKFVLLTDLKTS
ncbi:casparian strip membrane protein 1 [Artemisia annua]|uniref:CASP-like protein n=1 Tax=Artemisia annua TaxID=35608 RepID=A0A2U1NCN4_ARTAN|nr:casparian strip membrane protein 1 [Artemisia annua]